MVLRGGGISGIRFGFALVRSELGGVYIASIKSQYQFGGVLLAFTKYGVYSV